MNIGKITLIAFFMMLKPAWALEKNEFVASSDVVSHILSMALWDAGDVETALSDKHYEANFSTVLKNLETALSARARSLGLDQPKEIVSFYASLYWLLWEGKEAAGDILKSAIWDKSTDVDWFAHNDAERDADWDTDCAPQEKLKGRNIKKMLRTL